jgi:predicted acylesterase/phospholipase RssA
MKKDDIENLVFAGGGLKGLIHIGFLQVLEEMNILKQCKRYVGASIGSFFALLLSIDIKVNDIEKLFLCIDPKNIVSYNPENLIKLFDTLGCESSESLENILHIILSKKTGNPRITFIELYELTGKEVCFSVTNLSKRRGEYFNYKTTPNLEIAEGCMISMCIPFIFEPRLYDKCYYLDGGITSNFPIEYFSKSINKTLGISIQDYNIETPLELPTDIVSLFLAMYKTTISERILLKTAIWNNHIVTVYNDFPAFDFNITNSSKIKFIQCGRDETVAFFKKKEIREIEKWADEIVKNIINTIIEL